MIYSIPVLYYYSKTWIKKSNLLQYLISGFLFIETYIYANLKSHENRMKLKIVEETYV